MIIKYSIDMRIIQSNIKELESIIFLNNFSLN